MSCTFGRLFLLVSFWTNVAWTEDRTEKFFPPSKVELSRKSEFCVELRWNPPVSLVNNTCKVSYQVYQKKNGEKLNYIRSKLSFEECLDLSDGVEYGIRTKSEECPSWKESDWVKATIPTPAGDPQTAVKGFQCSFYMPQFLNCTWHIDSGKHSNYRMYYWLKNTSHTQECSTYIYDGSLPKGCHIHSTFLDLKGTNDNQLFILVNGTEGYLPVKPMYFEVNPLHKVKPEPPKMHFMQKADKLNIQWEPPKGFQEQCWKYQLQYKDSTMKEWQDMFSNDKTEESISYDPRYKYTLKMRAVYKTECGEGSSEWTEEEEYGEEQPVDWSLIILIIIPIFIAIAAITLLIYLKRLRLLILPRIPDPGAIFKHMFNINDDRMMSEKDEKQYRLFEPYPEEVCAVSVVEQCT
ncbi:interleukin-13 receptor subunit alpha-1 [Lepisosteus oculatus]|uniref:Interleukin-13 receptor subunit alpha-1-like n=1 Tax=Lepisosteus oculatus TaxID=7918 RepID=W5NA93_LEPOC|nr:PREDICTED: interleukin-13 receptor subunit alpha-1-like [Lepisosteus oculatus]XP_015206968.1 PREDICTED: interleukin-13 receptor subunit alpha-1-like [Lepisosteus oculatus]